MRAIVFVILAVGCGGAAQERSDPAPLNLVGVPESPHGEATSRSIAPAAAPTVHRIGALEVEVKRARGRAIDLDLKDADIRDVCRLLADVGHVNIVVSDDVTGSITLRMKQVPWDQALEVILAAKGFRQEREGNMILVRSSR